ncbi:HAD-IC family P-type ATPase [Streptomyces sp. NRRL S-1868]|uniref:HAD-IC family P-type ATPase n=1 Tax=Streptomyces sp. NRRL S-1868 TaxID=1463892 RepID=UPI00068E7165|nr:HAD-IC family P-type ATPase [Streptomyces sp. NRRL S-1868]
MASAPEFRGTAVRSGRPAGAASSLQTLRLLESGPRGLTEAQAEERLVKHGENTVPGSRPVPWGLRLARAVGEPFTAVLLCLGLVSAVIASWGTACVIAVLVVVSAVLRAAGERRAERSVAALGAVLPQTATVRRRPAEGAAPVHHELPVDQLVPGDVVRLGAGDLVPADVRLLRASGLTVHQAVLSGESAPVPKHAVDTGCERPVGNGEFTGPGAPDSADPVPGAKGTADTGPGIGGATGPGAGDATEFSAPHLCFQGSSVASGSATAVVVATGAHTRFADAWATPPGRRRGTFDRSVRSVAWLLIRCMLLIPPVALLADAAVRGRGLETLPFAVTVAVGLTPEMLPVVVTAALARAAGGLARRRAVLVRRLHALGDLGAAGVLCTDKTGTLTQDRPVLECSLAPDGTPDARVAQWAALSAFWTLHLAELPVPDPLDEALLDATVEPDGPAGSGDGGGADLGGLWDWEGVAALPFDPVRRLSCAVLRPPHADGTPGPAAAPHAPEAAEAAAGGPGEYTAYGPGEYTVVVKGAAEEVLERCALDDERRAELHRRAALLAEDGLRLLAVGCARRRSRLGPYVPGDERGLTFLGFVGLRDALAPTAARALAGLARQGVAVKVLTGDHPGTAARVCRDLGLLDADGTPAADAPSQDAGATGTVRPGAPPGVVTGAVVDTLDDDRLAEVAARSTVFARCTPAQKARVVRALRTRSTTGFLGDGVNDLAALHAADIGLCPRTAAPVAREAADVVLGAKELTAIEDAVAAGRRCGGAIASYLRIVLSSNLGNVLAMLVAGVLLPFLPMLPAQVLVQNLCFDAAQLALAFDRPGTVEGRRRPAVLRPRALLGFVTGFGLLNAAADVATFAVLALAVRHGTGTDSAAAFHSGWFTENLLTQAMVMLLLRTGGSAAYTRRPARPLLLAVAGLAAVGLLLPLSPLGAPLGMTPLPWVYYPMLALVLCVYGAALALARAAGERRAAGARPGRYGKGGKSDG